MKHIFLFDGKEKTGPFSEEDINNLKLTKKVRYWYEGMSQWLPVENLKSLSFENYIYSKPKKVRNFRLINIIWILTGIILFIVLMLYTFFFNEFGENELVQFYIFWFGAIVFCIVTLITAYSKSNRPLLYGLLGAISGTIFLIIFFGTVWSAL